MSASSEQRTTLSALCLTAPVALFIWSVQTDGFPLSQNVRPSSYIYGWPICFGTSSRGRFNFSSFDLAALAIDIYVFTVLVSCTFIAVRHILRRFPQYSLLEALTMLAGFGLSCVFVCGLLNPILAAVGYVPADPDYSETARNTRVLSRLFPLQIVSLCVGTFSVGLTTVVLPVKMFRKPSLNADHP